jgi:hypothetical protein
VLLLASVTVAGITFKSIGAVAAGVFVATLLWAIHQQLTLARPLGLAFAPLVPSLAALAALSCAMGIAVGLLLVWLHGWPAIVQLSACTVAGMACYLVLGRLLFGRITSPLFRSVRTILHSGGATT